MSRGAYLKYDDSQLRDLYAALTESERRKALRNAMRARARDFRKVAFGHLRSERPNVGTAAIGGFRMFTYYKDVLGFRVTVGKTGNARIKRTKIDMGGGLTATVKTYSKNIPTLMWLEDGTKTRFFKRHSRGKMPAVRFMVKAKTSTAGRMTAALGDDMRKFVVKEAKKHGCI